MYWSKAIDIEGAFLFGAEASGLSNNEISFSNYVLQIPSNSKFKSLNLNMSTDFPFVVYYIGLLFSVILLSNSFFKFSKMDSRNGFRLSATATGLSSR